jgi:hypothetical protein
MDERKVHVSEVLPLLGFVWFVVLLFYYYCSFPSFLLDLLIGKINPSVNILINSHCMWCVELKCCNILCVMD